MFEQQLNHRLGPEDNSFLVYDTETTPMNIGTIAVLEGRVPLKRFIENLEAKIHLIPRYRQVVVTTPFGVSRPTWEFDPDFDLRRHVFRLQVDPPGTLDQLFQVAARLHETRLDRDKPLWEIYLVDGLEGGNTGLVAKVHHCMADGVGGVSLLLVVLDASPSTEVTATAREEYAPPPLPGPLSQIADAVFETMSEGLDAVTSLEERLLDVATGAGGDWLRMMGASLRTALPYFLFPAEKTPFNKSFSGERRFAGLSVRFDEVQAIRKAIGGTVNDVALTALGGALGRYLEAHGEDVTGRSIRVFTPVNVRHDNEKETLGNHISMLVVEVPVSPGDPVDRLRTIVARTQKLKREHVSEGVGMLSNAVFALPVPVSKALIDVGALPLDRMGNMVCTNVPGPRFPLYTVGHRMLSMYPIVPVGWEMGIGCAIASYDQGLYFCLAADAGAAPDVELLHAYLIDAYAELRDAAGVPAT